MFVGAGGGEAAGGCGEEEGGFGGVLCDDEGVGGEEFAGAQEAKGLGVGLLVVVGGVEVEDVDGVRLEALEEGHGALELYGVAGGDFEGGEVCLQGLEGGGGVFCEEDVAGAAAEGLNAHGTGAGVEIDEGAVGDAGGDDVEEGFAEAV